MQRAISEKLPKVTVRTAKVVLSFENKEGGHLFAHSFRNDLMGKLHFFAERNVYLDNHALRNDASLKMIPRKTRTGDHDGTDKTDHLEPPVPMDRQLASSVYTSAFKRTNKDGTPNAYFEIGATTPGWKAAYKDALNEAGVMVVLYTDTYPTNANCVEEVQHFAALTGPKKLVVVKIIEENADPDTSLGPIFKDLSPTVFVARKKKVSSGPTALAPEPDPVAGVNPVGWKIPEHVVNDVAKDLARYLYPWLPPFRKED